MQKITERYFMCRFNNNCIFRQFFCTARRGKGRRKNTVKSTHCARQQYGRRAESDLGLHLVWELPQAEVIPASEEYAALSKSLSVVSESQKKIEKHLLM